MAMGSLAKLDVLIAQLESMAASFSSQQHLDPFISFDLLADLIWTIDDESKERIVFCQRKCEDALQSLLLLGMRPPVRYLASSAIAELMLKGESISIYSRASSLLGWLVDTKKSEPAAFIGAAQCLGTLYKAYGPKITSNLTGTSSAVRKLMKSQEAAVRQAGMQLLHDALEGCGGLGAWNAYAEALRVTLKWGITDKSPQVKATAAGCLRLFAVTGGPGFSPASLDSCAVLCLKASEDAVQSVQDGFAAALGALLALGLNPNAQIQPKSKSAAPPLPPKAMEAGLEKYLITPFRKAATRDMRVGVTMAWVAFLQEMRLSYSKSDEELGAYIMQVLSMLPVSIDPHAQACVLYICRVGIVEQMGELGQKELTITLCNQLGISDHSPPVLVVILRTLSYLLMTLGEVSLASRDSLDRALVSIVTHLSVEVRIEAALTLRGLAEVDPSLASNIMSCAVTTLLALREAVAVEKGDRLKSELAGLHGQAAMLASLLASFPKLLLGLPSRIPLALLDVGRRLVLQPAGNPMSAALEKEAGWMLISAFVSSVSKEELSEKQHDILPIWASSFGGSIDKMILQAGANLSAEISGWCAAAEALAAYIRNYVVPNLSLEREVALLQPVTKYLAGALGCLSAPALQQGPQALRSNINVFTIKTLRAFRVLPSPTMYKSQHTTLLRICTLPIREPSSFGGSSCLRQLLDHRDASLGPWLPGRDAFEDELRAFEGASNGLLPTVWEEVSVFPQSLPMETTLVDEMLLCLGSLFSAQTEATKLQLLEMMESNRAAKKQSWHHAVSTNVCVVLLGSLKKFALSRQEADGEVVKRIQVIFQEMLADETCSSLHRRAAAEGLGFLARVGNDVYAARLMRSLLNDASGITDQLHKGSIVFALGCIHRSVGGMALAALVPATVQTICSLLKDSKEPLWSLHGLALTIESAGLSFLPHVQVTLSVIMSLLLSEDHNAPELRQSIGRVVNAVIAVLGPELLPGSSLFSRCKSIVSVVSSGEEPAALLEGVRYTQQLVLFAPQAVSVHAHVESLLPTLFSKQPSLRQAAMSTLRHLCEKDPAAMITECIEEDLFSMLDTETDMQIIKTIRLTLERLLEATCPSLPSRWIQICRTVVLASSKTESSLGNALGQEGEDDEGSMIKSAAANSNEFNTRDQLPRYRTRVFAAECLSRIPAAVGFDSVHFDLVRAKKQKRSSGAACDYLVLYLGELIALAYQVATGEMESIRPIGVSLLDTLLEKFEKTEDPNPDYAGHLLLEQYQAQFLSAVRTALEPSAGPLLMAAGARLAARIVTSGVSGGDRGVLQRVLNLISRPLSEWEVLNYSAYAEWVGCQVRAGLLGAHAAVKTYALACLRSGAQKSAVGHLLIPLLGKHIQMLNSFWIGLLRDYTMLCTQLSRKMQTKYTPFLEGIESPAIASQLQPYLYEVCALILEAVAIDAVPATDAFKSDPSALIPVVLNDKDFLQIWALSTLLLTDYASPTSERHRYTRSFPSFRGRIIMGAGGPGNANLQLVALRALRCLCSKFFFSSEMLSVDLCRELLLMLQYPSFRHYSWAPMAILCITEQIVNSMPDSYFDNEDLVFAAANISMSFFADLLSSECKVFESEVICSSFSTMGCLISRSTGKTQAQLAPQLFCAGLKALSRSGLSDNVLSSIVAFLSRLTTVVADSSERAIEHFPIREKCSLLSSAVESLAQLSLEQNIGQRLPLVLGALVAIARSIPKSETAKELSFSAQTRCVDCLRTALLANDAAVQLAAIQTLMAALQAGIAEQPKGGNCTWALMLMHELGADVASLHTIIPEGQPISHEATHVLGESLKLLVLLHSLVSGDEAQRGVLSVLLTTIVSATTVAPSVAGVAVQLVTNLASVPASANQFKAVMLELAPEDRTKLQDIIRSSVMPDSRLSAAVPGPIKVPITPKPLIPSVVPKQLSPASSPKSPSNEEEDEWDDFQ